LICLLRKLWRSCRIRNAVFWSIIIAIGIDKSTEKSGIKQFVIKIDFLKPYGVRFFPFPLQMFLNQPINLFRVIRVNIPRRTSFVSCAENKRLFTEPVRQLFFQIFTIPCFVRASDYFDDVMIISSYAAVTVSGKHSQKLTQFIHVFEVEDDWLCFLALDTFVVIIDGRLCGTCSSANFINRNSLFDKFANVASKFHFIRLSSQLFNLFYSSAGSIPGSRINPSTVLQSRTSSRSLSSMHCVLLSYRALQGR